jgi:hypothetical protein
MKSLMIEDLSLSQALDRKALSAVHGGVMPGGCVVNPFGLPPLPILPQMPGGFPPVGPTSPWYPCF